MEPQFKKTLKEKFGDFYSQPGKRALFSLGCIGIGALLGCVFPSIGIIVLYVGMMSLLSYMEKEKVRYLQTVEVVLPGGQKTECAIFSKKSLCLCTVNLCCF